MVEPRVPRDIEEGLEGLIKPDTANMVLKLLMVNDSLTSEEIRKFSSLSKAEVASGIRALRWRGWVISAESESDRPGRSPHLWSLAISKENILQFLINELTVDSHLITDALRNLSKIK